MRHRAQNIEQSSGSGAKPDTIIQPTATETRVTGKHRAPVAPRIPLQAQPTHDSEVEPQVVSPRARLTPVATPAPVIRRRPAVEVTPATVPVTATWTGSHLPRILAGTVLVLAGLGTSGLAVRYAQSRTSEDFVSLVVGLVVVVVLWAIMMASAPQTVTIENSILTVHNTGGTERFDLAEALQSVDVVGNPRTSYWAVLLHRANDATVVLRRNDVVATELDPIVRHYRAIADQRRSDREARFNH